MTTEQTTSEEKQTRDPDCFEQWICERLRERPDRQDEGAGYDRTAKERGRDLANNETKGKGTAKDREGGSTGYSGWMSDERFFYGIHGPEQLGYELDEDDYPIDGEVDGSIEEG